MNIMKVEIGRKTYPVYIGQGLLDNIREILRDISTWQAVFLLTDTNLEKLYMNKVLDCFKGQCTKVNYMVIPREEEGKSMEIYERIIQRLTELSYDRKSLLITLGGGAVGDIGGFVASTYMRGMDLIHIPTTLLAQVDSSIGGKTAINYYGFKNLIGTFYHPKGVIIDVDTLKSLDKRLYQSAFAEIIKYGLIGNLALLQDLYHNAEGYLNFERDIGSLVKKCIEMKCHIVGRDEEDQGERMVLNLGHTFGHGIESVTEFKIFLHGQAVGLGIWMAAKLAHKLGKISLPYYQFIERILTKYSFTSTKVKFDPQQLLNRMGLDKKNTSGRIRFILPIGEGQVSQFTDVPTEAVRQVIMEVNDEASNT